jgi:small multidrug resistance pump
MLTAWVLVGGAIVAEITAAIMLRSSDGFKNLMPSLLALGAFGAAFYLVSLALVDLPVSTVYPVWAGGGTAGVALVGVLMLGEKSSAPKILGVMMVVAGIVVLNLASAGQIA